MSNTNPKLGRLAKLGLLAALSIVLVFFIHFPIFPTAKFLEYDPADIPIMIATFAFGPWYGLMTTIVVAVVPGAYRQRLQRDLRHHHAHHRHRHLCAGRRLPLSKA